MNHKLTIGQCATLACLLEATAPKVGNVHRGADFDDLTFTDFAVSSVAIAPAMESAAGTGVGRAVLDAVTATRAVVSTNTNLGMALLMAPLAAVPIKQHLTPRAVGEVLSAMRPADARLVYEAIRIAQPGGLGKADEMDIADQPPDSLLKAMQAAAERDLVARQYVENFELVLAMVGGLFGCRLNGWSLTESIVYMHIKLIADHGDSLIARKCGPDVAKRASAMAAQVLAAGHPGDDAYYAAAADFDFWLRSDGNRRNPGTTADLIATTLFAGLRDGLLQPPWR
jgi:triphosphoribosyl-dephospho-CoA synthase